METEGLETVGMLPTLSSWAQKKAAAYHLISIMPFNVVVPLLESGIKLLCLPCIFAVCQRCHVVAKAVHLLN